MGGYACSLPAHQGLAPGSPQSTAKQAAGQRSALLLLGVWAGYGVIDVLFKQLAKSGLASNSSLIITFVLAGLLMFAHLFRTATRWHGHCLAAGLLLGLFDFVYISFY